MKAAALALALAVGGRLPAQDPRPPQAAPVAKATKAAATGWQYSRWGMTGEQIAAASGGAAPSFPPSSRTFRAPAAPSP